MPTFDTMNYFLPSRIKRCLLLFLFAACLLPTCIFSQDTWTQKTNFGGAGREGAVGFSIGTKGYIGT